MQKKSKLHEGNIVLGDPGEIKPNDITVGYLVDTLNLLKPIAEHDYDVSIRRLEFDTLGFLKEKESLKKLLCSREIFSINRLYRLKLLDLSYVGLGLCPENQDGAEEESSRYGYLEEFIKCANKAIREEKAAEKRYSELWNEQYEENLKKFDHAQCKNKIKITALYRIKGQLRGWIKRGNKLLIKKDSEKILKFIEEGYRFLYGKLLILDKYLPLSFNRNDSLFKQLGMSVDEKIIQKTRHSKDELLAKLDGYRYIFNSFYRFLSNDLNCFKQRKIKKATDCFLVDTQELKLAAINDINGEEDYVQMYRFDLGLMYSLYRNSMFGHINKIIEKDIRKRQIIDGFVQYTPSACGLILFFVSLGLSFTYTFTLLKEMWERHNLMIIFSCITGCALMALLNLYRNAKQFKRPKRKKFSIYSLASYLAITVIFFSLNLYFIYRYDGYNETYYYVYDKNDASSIVVDGLRDRTKLVYDLPRNIDDYQVSVLSDNVFKRNRKVKVVDLSDTGIQRMGDGCFSGCVKLQTVKLPESVREIPQKAFKKCSLLHTVTHDAGLTKIEAYAFSGCKKLVNINLSTITSMENNAFESCSSLGKIVFSEELKIIPKAAFKNSVSVSFDVLPLGIVEIGADAFSGCKLSETLVIPGSVDKISKDAFENCNNIEALRIENYSVIPGGDLSAIFGKLDKLTSLILDGGRTIPDNFLSFCLHIKTVSVNGEITSIGNNAFKDCTGLSSCKISGNVTKIGKEAFANCLSLNELIFENLSISQISEKAFYNCLSLKDFSIPSTVVSIEDEAFFGCKGISEVTVPVSVKKIGDNIFTGCSELRSLTVPITSKDDTLKGICGENVTKTLSSVRLNNAKYIPDSYFDGCAELSILTIDNDVQSIGKYAFKNCVKLGNFGFVTAASKIGEGAFYGCKQLSAVTFNETIVKLPDYVFYDCDSITEVSLPNHIKEIGAYAYAECNSITLIDFGKGVAKAESGAFAGCDRLTEINIPLLNTPLNKFLGSDISEKLSKITVDTSKNTKIPDYYFSDCLNLTDLVFDGNITSIGKYAFNGCVLLTSLNIADTASKIGDRAFNNCSSLVDIQIPDSVKEIGENVLGGCVNLRRLTLPVTSKNDNLINVCDGNVVENLSEVHLKNAQNIPDAYFKGCSSLSVLTMDTAVQSIGEYAFKNCYKLTDFCFVSTAAEIGEGAFYGCKQLSEITFNKSVIKLPRYVFYDCDSITEVILPNHIKELGTYAYAECDRLVSVDFGKNVNKSEDNVFKGCDNLREVKIPLFNKPLKDLLGTEEAKKLTQIAVEAVETGEIPNNYFAGCSHLTNVEFNGNITVIGKYAFDGCVSLEALNIDDTVFKIEDRAFNNCSSLVDIQIPISVKKIGENVLGGCGNLRSLTLPITSKKDSLFDICDGGVIKTLTEVHLNYARYIPSSYFEGCNALSVLTVDTDIQSIGEYAFKNCYNLSDFSFVSDARKIGEGVFYGCRQLSAVTFNESVTKLPSYVFYDCDSITEVVLPNHIKEIGEYAYAECDSLTSIDLGQSVNKSADNTFMGCDKLSEIKISLFNKPLKDFFGTEVVKNFTQITVEAIKMRKIPKNYFAGCSRLTNVVFNGNITEIGKYAFDGCISLEKLVIADTISKIDDHAFNNCTSLVNIQIPIAVKKIGKEIFSGCYSIREVTVPIADTRTFVSYFPKKFGVTLDELILTGTETIPDNYFADFTGFKSFDLTHYKKIGENAFKNTGLTSITIPKNINEIGKGAFSNCVNLKNAVIESEIKKLPDYMFAECELLSDVTVSTSTDEIGEKTFSNCEHLAKFENWGGIRKLNANALENCVSLNDIKLGGLSFIGANAFYGCKLSEKLTLYPNCEYAENAFNNVSGVKELTVSRSTDKSATPLEYYLGSTASSITQISLGDVHEISKGYFKNISGIKNISIAGKEIIIGEKAFTGMGKLTKISILNGVEKIGEKAFSGCNNLKSVVFAGDVKIIEDYAFYDCTKLSNVSLADNVEYIGKKVFNENTRVTNSDTRNQCYISKWHKNWNSRRAVNFKTIIEDIADFIVSYYIIVILLFSVFVGLVVILKKRRLKRT